MPVLDPYARAAKALALTGKDAADEVTLFELRHMKAIGDLVERENIDCDFTVTQVTDVWLYESGAEEQKANLEKLTAAGTAGIEDVSFSKDKDAERVGTDNLLPHMNMNSSDLSYQASKELEAV